MVKVTLVQSVDGFDHDERDGLGVRRASDVAYHRGMIKHFWACLTVASLVWTWIVAAEESLETILAAPLPPEAYAAPVRCVAMRTSSRIEVLDEYTLLMRGPGKRSWVAQTYQRCRGLRNEHLLDFQQRRGRICTGDSFRGLIPASERLAVTPVCGIRVIHEVDDDQITALGHAIRARRFTSSVLGSPDRKSATKE